MKTIEVNNKILVTAYSDALYQAFQLSVEYMDISLTRDEMAALADAAQTIVRWYDDESVQSKI